MPSESAKKKEEIHLYHNSRNLTLSSQDLRVRLVLDIQGPQAELAGDLLMKRIDSIIDRIRVAHKRVYIRPEGA